MAKSTRGDSSRETTSRQPSRGNTSTSRGVGGGSASTTRASASTPAAGASASRGGASPSRSAQSAQVGGATPSTQARQSDTSDRERSIDTGSETGQSRQTTGITGVEPGQTASPVRGGTADLPASPFAAMRRWSEDMDRLFQDFGFGRIGFGLSPWRNIAEIGRQIGPRRGGRSDWEPQVEVFRRGDNVVVRADLPGLKKEDVNVEVEDDVLTISGERNEEHEEKREGFYRSERSYGEFYRAIPLPEGVNSDQCEASFKDGVLEVTLRAPKRQEKPTRQIPIR